MDNYLLIYDPGIPETERNNFFEKLNPAPASYISLDDFSLEQHPKDEILLFWLSDSQSLSILEQLNENSAEIAFLPHPELVQLAKGLGIPASKEDAFYRFKESEKFQEVDLLEVNDQLVLNSLVIGESLGVFYDPQSKGFFKGLRERILHFSKLLRKVSLQKFSISFGKIKEEKRNLDIAAMGIMAVAHCETNFVFRRLIKDSGLHDGQIHLLILAPKSLSDLIYFGLKNLFFPSKSNQLPDFVSYLAVEELEIKSPDPIHFACDGKESQSQQLQLKISPKKGRILTGFIPSEESGKPKKELNLGILPTGDLREELTKGYLPWTRHATTEEFKELFLLLKENAQTSSTFLVLMALSTLIATFGLFANSTPVVIGAMILAPLMGPIISLAMGMLRQDGTLIKNSLITVFWGVLFGLFFSVMITWFTPLKTMNTEILSRIRPNLLDLGIAVASGIAGAYAHSKEEIAKTLAGVAISVALVPPLAVAGIGLGWNNWNVFGGAMLLWGTNLAGIVMAAAVTFLFLGFSPFRLAQKGLLVSILILIGITTPLALSFREMVRENAIIQNLSGREIPHGLLRDVNVISFRPLRLSVTILSEKELNAQDFKEIKTEIESRIEEPVQLELTLGAKILE
ncbi:TIGR00341 family protein [Algoriphagus sp. CAU 1675]|uniref:TIGR00341 family protein n=1 Tax=Algoriphagus sp. CAU 1675 TaxID=3032597 RepID=UPI0023D9AD69|nr:TIGR00341 family protein [Algoriphagus sp. CAU 1675]MDF2159237.1 TIGR00341 family protein [Algoriphagus sp. CAU 1675]